MNEHLSGETITKKRQNKVFLIIAISVAIGVLMSVVGAKYDHNLQNIPLWVIIGVTFFILLLTVYYYRLRDEYQKMRDFKHLAYGLFLAVGIVVPWYFAGLKGLLPTPHVLMTFFIICIPTYIMTIVSWFSR